MSETLVIKMHGETVKFVECNFSLSTCAINWQPNCS